MTEKEKRIYAEIADWGKQHAVQKIVLFGSRARGTNELKSDIDLAVYGCNDFREFYFDINEKVDTLLEFDIIDMEQNGISAELVAEIERDGVVLYEKI
jgi:predicted nucleotidyltransferase